MKNNKNLCGEIIITFPYNKESNDKITILANQIYPIIKKKYPNFTVDFKLYFCDLKPDTHTDIHIDFGKDNYSEVATKADQKMGDFILNKIDYLWYEIKTLQTQ